MLLLPDPSSEREQKGEDRGAKGATLVSSLERSDVIECVVQFLADGLVLHLLCIDFVWRGSRDGWECGEREQKERGKDGGG